MKILLERMKTHPEEFFRGYTDAQSKWGMIVDRYRNVLTEEEMKAYNEALNEIARQQFTASVLESLLAEPVKIDPNTYTINTVGRDPWGSITLNQKPAYDYQEEYRKLLQTQIDEVKVEQLKLAAEAYKKEMKNKSPFEKIKGKKYP